MSLFSPPRSQNVSQNLQLLLPPLPLSLVLVLVLEVAMMGC